MLSRKAFLKFYKNEMEFADLHGVTISAGHAQELNDMHSIYDNTKTDKEFTTQMSAKGFGLI